MMDDCYDCGIRDTCLLYRVVDVFIEKYGMNPDVGEGFDFLTNHRCNLYVKDDHDTR